ncbi:DUF2742 domain-containing protein [Mycolicibacterium fluoranthenivorans]|uniref:DUF2742 domain-containing protein n=1 Tax=Mycolicibacterium fluoranthenivorans TaxID=258505 RepID=A0A1G4WM20_9MYCO|nr:Protein of unknown function [Mycolicibacterium fluoranthenivorans]
MTDPNLYEDAPATIGGGTPESRQVNWYAVFRFVEHWSRRSTVDLFDHGLLIPGTPRWCALPDDDARKLMAVILGGVREALNHDVVQEHRADASREIAASQDWAVQAKRLTGRSGPAYIPRKAS